MSSAVSSFRPLPSSEKIFLSAMLPEEPHRSTNNSCTPTEGYTSGLVV
jgi:hypothetical protein